MFYERNTHTRVTYYMITPGIVYTEALVALAREEAPRLSLTASPGSHKHNNSSSELTTVLVISTWLCDCLAGLFDLLFSFNLAH